MINSNENQEIVIITCSYGPDFLRCQRLCHSMDQWVDSRIKHILIVPQRDLARFSSLVSERRSLQSVEAVVPGRYRQIIGFNKWWLDPKGWPVRGWVMQQVTKLSANFATEAEYIIFADSDIQFIRPLKLESVLVAGRLRLHRIPGAKNSGEHLEWHKQAGKLLGISEEYAGSDYIGQLITWRRSQLAALQHRIEQISQAPWYYAVGRSLRVSEYILYGMFVDRFVGQETNGHFYSEQDLCHCCWDANEVIALRSPDTTVDDHAIAVLVQSNLGLTSDEEQSLVQMAVHKIQPERA